MHAYLCRLSACTCPANRRASSSTSSRKLSLRPGDAREEAVCRHGGPFVLRHRAACRPGSKQTTTGRIWGRVSCVSASLILLCLLSCSCTCSPRLR
ncbi:hypothetical protein K466DRAFT_282567 [Polyporus arcularius HHB13444]|uniref:Uncharacterized protein n=1 Tax=Polyporus arcularius HHB13444 TaxID=1314778 RepID=A0A5C3NZK8_9APHY|nr:hypothetical protein K466DRAFT_282567 [Polyporus arcularius HHB13444]